MRAAACVNKAVRFEAFSAYSSFNDYAETTTTVLLLAQAVKFACMRACLTCDCTSHENHGWSDTVLGGRRAVV